MKTIVDQMHQSLELVNNPQRIISIVPSQTELLHYWGLDERVVGITKFCIHPNDWYRNKKRVGGTKNLNFEAIAALKPDLIIGNKEENTQSEIERLQEEYPVWMSDMHCLEDAWEMMSSLGQVLNLENKATALVQQLKSDFKDLEKVITATPTIKVAYFIWKDPLMVAGGRTFIHDLLQKAGFENVFEQAERYPVITPDDLKKKGVEVVFLSSEPYPFQEKHIAAFQKLCPDAQIEIVDGELFSWYGSRLLHSVNYLKKLREKLLG